MKNKDDFYSLIKKKIEVTPKKEFHDNFWNKFEEIRERETVSSRSHYFSFAMALSAALVLVTTPIIIERKINVSNEVIASDVKEMLLNDDIGSNMELVAQLDDIKLSDEEWEILLHGG